MDASTIPTLFDFGLRTRVVPAVRAREASSLPARESGSQRLSLLSTRPECNLEMHADLKSFEFQRPDESGELIETLKEHCGRSLESLALKSLFQIGKKPVTALHEFQTLRKLTIFEDTFIDDNTNEFEKPVNVLPPTIEVVPLLILDWKSGIQVLRDMPSRAGTTVPNLHTLRVGRQCRCRHGSSRLGQSLCVVAAS